MKVDVQYLEGPVLDYLVAQFNLDTVRKNFVIYQREPCLVTAWDPENVGHYPIVCKLVAPDGKEYIGKGSTLLIAASKMLVLMTFGPEVEVPDELQ